MRLRLAYQRLGLGYPKIKSMFKSVPALSALVECVFSCTGQRGDALQPESDPFFGSHILTLAPMG